MIATPISREMLLHVVKALPAAPMILSQLGQILLDLNKDLSDITRLLRCDAALTARLIRISNSASYNTGQPHASLEEALGRVGLNEVYRLTGLAAVSEIADHPLQFYGITGVRLRENSLLTAIFAESLAASAGLDPRMGYTAGLLRSIGKLALDRLVRHGVSVTTYEHRNTGGLADWELALAGSSNCDAAAVILPEWRFPDEMIVGIRDQYLISGEAESLAIVLNLAAGAAEKAGFALPGEAVYWRDADECLKRLEIGPEQLEKATGNGLVRFQAIRSTVG